MDEDELSLSEVAKRRKLLIRYGLWDRMDADSIEAWCSEFVHHESKVIATIALDALIVRTQDSAEVAMWHFLSSVIPNINNSDSKTWKNAVIPRDLLSKPNLFNIRIVRLEQNDSPFGSGQSSDDIIRLLKYRFSVHEYYFSEPDPNSKIIIIDELSASGTQAGNSLLKWVNKYDNEIFVYFLAIHSQGLKHIRDLFPSVKIFYAERLGPESSLSNALVSYGLANEQSAAQKIIKDFTKEHFRKDNWTALGFGNLSLCFRPAFTTCNNLAGLYLSKTKTRNVCLFHRGIG